jgi:hypothetical protein
MELSFATALLITKIAKNMMHAIHARLRWIWLLSVFLVRVLLRRITPLIDFIGYFPPFMDTILSNR